MLTVFWELGVPCLVTRSSAQRVGIKVYNHLLDFKGRKNFMSHHRPAAKAKIREVRVSRRCAAVAFCSFSRDKESEVTTEITLEFCELLKNFLCHLVLLKWSGLQKALTHHLHTCGSGMLL